MQKKKKKIKKSKKLVYNYFFVSFYLTQKQEKKNWTKLNLNKMSMTVITLIEVKWTKTHQELFAV